MAVSALLVFLGFTFALAAWFIHSSRRNRVSAGLKQLPGPKGYPILGSVPDIPEKNSFIKFAEWGKEYGPIYQVNLAGSNHIWISSDHIARDLLAKKGAIYSDRPHIPALLSDNRTSAQYLPLLSKNDHWARQRKFATTIMKQSEAAVFHRYPELEATRMLFELLEEPHLYNHALESFVSRVTCRLAWGRSEASDELKQRARELLIGVSPTGALGNKLPFLMSLPDWLVPAKAWERRRAATEQKFFEIMQWEVEADMKEKDAPESWMSMFLKNPAKWSFQYPLEGAYCVGMHGIAGALTIAAPMQTFCLAMCFYPQYLPMLHEELDRVCGDRLPRSEDRPNLPFLRAVIRECLRWRPPVPTGIPHYLVQDDVYNGYHIPAGSVMHPLEWAIARDPDMFPDPDAFNPVRWLDPAYPTYKEPLTQYPTIINSTQFGYGRRLCQGQAVADEDLLIGIGAIAWLFDMSRAPDDGKSLYSEPDVVVDPEKVEGDLIPEINKTISNEELYTGTIVPDMPLEDFLVNKYHYPGAFPPDPEGGPKQPRQSDKKSSLDPTLDFTTLLIAKPLPFKFHLRSRNAERERIIRESFAERVRDGSFTESRRYWGPDNGKDQPLGWGKV